jgi:hypothetical protein
VCLFVAVVATALLLFELLLVARAVFHWSVAVGARRGGWAGSRWTPCSSRIRRGPAAAPARSAALTKRS